MLDKEATQEILGKIHDNAETVQTIIKNMMIDEIFVAFVENVLSQYKDGNGINGVGTPFATAIKYSARRINEMAGMEIKIMPNGKSVTYLATDFVKCRINPAEKVWQVSAVKAAAMLNIVQAMFIILYEQREMTVSNTKAYEAKRKAVEASFTAPENAPESLKKMSWAEKMTALYEAETAKETA